MKLIGRLLMTIAEAFLRPTLAVEEVSRCTFRVLPTDLDFNLHMNNGRFLQVMDLGRVDWMLRTGIAQNAFRHKRRLILAGVMTRYLRELRLFQSYTLTTRLIGWSRTSFYIEHQFEDTQGRLVAVGTVRAMMTGARGLVPASVVAADHWRYRSPQLPAYVQSWDRAERLMQAGAKLDLRTRATAAEASPAASTQPVDPDTGTTLQSAA